MTRRRVAFLLAATLGVVALGLVVAIAFLELSPRDYRLAWMLRGTRRIEFSSPRRACRVIEIDDPKLVAAIVSAMTTRLDRLPEAKLTRLTGQIHFLLEDGKEVVAALGTERETSFVRFPGERVLRAYATSSALREAVSGFAEGHAFEPSTRPIHLGRTRIDGREVDVEFDCHWGYDQGYYLEGEIAFLWQGDRPSVRNHADVTLTELMRPEGSRVDLHAGEGYESGRSFLGGLACLPIGLQEIDAIELTYDGRNMTFKVPASRYHDIIIPQCSKCGAVDDVVPWVPWPYLPVSGPPFPGRVKIDPMVTRALPSSELGPSFFCERCQASF